MNNWEILIVPLIALGVWILSTIFRGAAEAKEKERPGPDRPRSPGRPQSELDRFLEEARRRRDQAQQRKGDPVEQPEQLPVAVLEPPPPPPRPVEQSPPRRREGLPMTVGTEKRKPRKESKPAAVAPPLPTTPPVKNPFEMPVNLDAVLTFTQPGSTTETPATPEGGEKRKRSPLLLTLTALLHDKQSLAAAMVLHEILGPPRCMSRK